MSNLGLSLLYDAVAGAVLVTVAWTTTGFAHQIAVLLLTVTVAKVPYDTWDARRRDRASSRGPWEHPDRDRPLPE